MPRPNRPRAIAAEKALARRIAWEREDRGWSYAGVAKRMETAGCPINQSALYKIENGDPPRRISVDELVALAKVMDLSLDDLLVPPDLREERKARELIGKWRDAQLAADLAFQDVASYAVKHPQLAPLIEQELPPEDWPDFQTLTGQRIKRRNQR